MAGEAEGYVYLLKVGVTAFFGVMAITQAIRCGSILNQMSDGNVGFIIVCMVIALAVTSFAWPLPMRVARALGHN